MTADSLLCIPTHHSCLALIYTSILALNNVLCQNIIGPSKSQSVVYRTLQSHWTSLIWGISTYSLIIGDLSHELHPWSDAIRWGNLLPSLKVLTGDATYSHHVWLSAFRLDAATPRAIIYGCAYDLALSNKSKVNGQLPKIHPLTSSGIFKKRPSSWKQCIQILCVAGYCSKIRSLYTFIGVLSGSMIARDMYSIPFRCKASD